jgi:hypothetical protein
MADAQASATDTPKHNSTQFSWNSAFVIAGIVLFVVLLGLRFFFPGRIDVKIADLFVIVLPAALWLLGSGQIESLRIGTTGVLIKSVQTASSKTLGTNVKSIDVNVIKVAEKEHVSRLPVIKWERPTALAFVVQTSGTYYGSDA